MRKTNEIPPHYHGQPNAEGKDDYDTPTEVLEYLLPHLEKDWVIWEPACGRGSISEFLKKKGFKVIATDLNNGRDFLEWAPDNFDCVITNPPFSQKDKFIERCYELGKPWALLLPITALEGKKRQALYEEHGVSLIVFNKRIQYGDRGSSTPFSSAWFTWKLGLPDVINYAKLAGGMKMKDVKPWDLVEMGLAEESSLEQIKTMGPSGVRDDKEIEDHTHTAIVDENGLGETKSDDSGHVHKVRNYVALYAGGPPHIHKLDREEKKNEEWECECLECGHTMLTDKHCNSIKCPKCGAEMRRKDRPGPGKERGAANSGFKTTKNSNHTHDADVDEDGNGKTNEVEGHSHKVENWVAKAEKGHSHMVIH